MNEFIEIIKKNIDSDLISSRRLFHGRGKLIESLKDINIDYFPPTILISLYKEIDLDSVKELADLIIKNTPLEIKNILVKRRDLKNSPMGILKGEIDLDPIALEFNLKYKMSFNSNLNVGFFLDTKNLRKYLLENSTHKKILNLFSYTSSLSVAALKGNANKVINVDMSKNALNTAKENHRINEIDMNKVQFFSYDILKSFGMLAKKGPYDLIIIDPPSSQGDSFNVERDYYKIIKRLDAMTSDEAEVVACLNSPHLSSAFLLDLFKEHAPNFIFKEQIKSAFDEMETSKEEGLKILVFKKSTI